jgi:hypothetical protein
MADLHIEDFYRDVATIFLRLYASFPRKITLYVDDICGPDQPDEFGLHHPRFQAGFSALVWLAEQGYLQFGDTIREEAADEVVLTRRGFLLMSSRSQPGLVDTANEEDLPPSVMADSLLNIACLRHAVKDGSSILIRRCVNALLAQPAIGERS